MKNKLIKIMLLSFLFPHTMTATYADTGHFIKDSVTAHATAKSRNRGSGINHESRENTKINTGHNSVNSDGHDTRIFSGKIKLQIITHQSTSKIKRKNKYSRTISR